LPPFFRKRSRSQATSPLLLQQFKDHIKMVSKKFSSRSLQRVRFGIKGDFIERQGFRRCEEQIEIFESLCQDEALHLVELLFTRHVGNCSVAESRPAIFNKVIERFLAPV